MKAASRKAARVTTLADLRRDPRSARRHGPRNIGMIKQALEEVGAGRSILIDGKGEVIAGNGVLEAAALAGVQKVQVVDADGRTIIAVRRSDLKGKAKRRMALLDNRAGELAEWDTDALQEMAASEAEVLSGLFDEAELQRLLGPAAASGDPGPRLDEAKELVAKWGVRPGQLWSLGAHRVGVGDATKRDDVRRLLDGESVDLVFTDPPYNMAYKSGRLGGIANDDLSDRAFVSLVLGSLGNLKQVMRAGASFYVCMGALAYPVVYHQLRKLGLAGRPLIWAKPCAGLGQSDYRPQYEVIYYGFVGPRSRRTWNARRVESDLWEFDASRGVIARFNRGRTVIEVGQGVETAQIVLEGRVAGQVIGFDGEAGDLWQLGREQADYVHPTQKPVALIERALRNSSAPGDLVADTFLGSGSTVVACEQLGRKCRGLELDPRFLAVTIERWAGMTGEKPRLMSRGLSGRERGVR